MHIYSHLGADNGKFEPVGAESLTRAQVRGRCAPSSSMRASEASLAVATWTLALVVLLAVNTSAVALLPLEKKWADEVRAP